MCLAIVCPAYATKRRVSQSVKQDSAVKLLQSFFIIVNIFVKKHKNNTTLKITQASEKLPNFFIVLIRPIIFILLFNKKLIADAKN